MGPVGCIVRRGALVVGLTIVLAAGWDVLSAAPPAAKPLAARDCHGDPLPAGACARLGTVRFRQPGQVVFLRFSPDGRLLVSAGGDSIFRLWETASGRLLQEFPGLILGQASAAFSRDGQTFTFVGRDNHVHVRDLAAGKDRRVVPLPPGGVIAVALAPDGKTAALLSPPQPCRLWDLTTNQELRRVDLLARGQKGQQMSLTRLAFSPDGKRLVAGGQMGNQIAIFLADISGTREPESLAVLTGGFSSVLFSPAGNLVAVVVQNQEVHLLDAGSRKPVSQVSARGVVDFSLAFAPDGKRLAVASAGGVDLVEAATGNSLRKFPAFPGVSPCVAISPDGKTLAIGGADATIRLWDTATGKEVHPHEGHAGALGAAVYSPDGTVVATSAADVTIRLWDPRTGREVRRFTREHKAGVAVGPALLTFAGGGKLLAAAWADGLVYRWDVSSGKPLSPKHDFGPAYLLSAFSPDGASLARVTPDGAVHLWDVATGQEFRRLGGPAGKAPPAPGMWGAISAIAFAPDGRTVATGLSSAMFNPYMSTVTMGGPPTMAGTSIKLWEVASGKERAALPVDSTPASTYGLPPGGFNPGWGYMGPGFAAITRLAFSPDSRTLAVAANGIRLWDLAARRERRRLDVPAPIGAAALAFSPDGKIVALGGPGLLVLCDPVTGAELARRELHHQVVTALAFSPDGRTLTTGMTDTTALVWDVRPLLDEARRRGGDPSRKQLEALWQELGSADAGKAYEAMWALARAARPAVPFLRDRVRPVPLLGPGRIARLVANLEHERYAVRQQATRELERLGELAEPALRQALAGNPALELRRRAEKLLVKATAPISEPAMLQALRAVEALEHAGTAEARQVLEDLAGGAPEARLTREARAALERWARKRSS
jgi:WD40 repeat protein